MRLKYSAKNGIIGVITLLILALVGFVVTKILVSTIGIEYNGLNGLFNNIISILSITELGLSAAISYNLYKPIIEKDTEKINSIMFFYRKCYRIIGITIMALALIVTIFIPIFVKDSSFTNNYIRIVFLLFALNSSISYFFSYRRSLFYANQKEYVNTIIDFIMKLVKHILQIAVLMIFENYVAFLIINILLTFINNVFIYVKSKKEYPEIDLTQAKRDKVTEKKIINSVKSLAIVQVLTSLNSFTDNILISSLISITIAGFYTNYYLIITELNRVITTVYNGLGASIGNLIAEGKQKKIKEIFTNIDYLSFFIGSFCCVSLYIIMEPFVKIWVGSEYLLPNICLLILAINFYLVVIKQPLIYFLKNSGNFKSLIIPMGIECLLNLIISIVLAINIGLVGILIGTLISSIISYALIILKIGSTFDLEKAGLIRDQIVFALITIIELILLKMITNVITINNTWLNLIALGIICLILPNLISIIILKKSKKLDYLRQVSTRFLERFKGKRSEKNS